MRGSGRGARLNVVALSLVVVVSVILLPRFSEAADQSKVKAATGQVEAGAKKIGDGNIGTGVEDMAKGVGHTVVEGGKYTGNKLEESAKAAEPHSKDAGRGIASGAKSFGRGVASFFKTLFSR